MVNMLESKTIEVVEDPESEPEVDNKPESRSEVVAELVTLQEEINSRPTEVVEMPIKTHVDFLAEPTLELIPLLTVMRASTS